jgi:fucose 4-O-acetylase-like acetyltransferase
MKRNLLTFLILFLIPQLAFASDNPAVFWWLTLLVVTQIFIVVLNFKNKRSIKDKFTLIIIYAIGIATPWQHFLNSEKNLHLYAIYLLLMQYLFYRGLLFLEKKVKEHVPRN